VKHFFKKTVFHCHKIEDFSAKVPKYHL